MDRSMAHFTDTPATPDKAATDKKLALVTGASSGIGYELAKQFAQLEFDLIVAAEDDAIVQAAQDFEKLGATTNPVQVDLADYEGVEKLYTEVRGARRRLDAAAINAGVGVGGDFTHQTDLDAELRLIDLNVKSTAVVSKTVFRQFRFGQAANGRSLFPRQ
jgi:short-subunit dehydrogenase